MRHLLQTGSAIRRVWEQGLQLKALHGAEAVADMTLGNPAAPPPAALVEALGQIVAESPADLHLYTPNAGHPEVREQLAAHLHERGLLPGARREHVVMTCGASAAINIALRSVLEPGDEVLILAPHFPDYPAHVLNHAGKPVIVPVGEDFLPDLGMIEAALGERTRVLIVNHPNNPSGRQYPPSLIEELATLLRGASQRARRPIYLLSDEPYRELRFIREPFVSPARLYEYGLMAYSFSKSHSIPGERIGYLAINPGHPEAKELVRALSLANRILGFTNAPSLWQRVIARCLDAVVDLEPLRRHRDRLVTALADKGYDVLAPEGTFYLFPRTPGGDDEAFVQRALDQLLLVVPGGTFGRAGHFRIAFCVDERTAALAAERLPHATVGGRA
ncbi:MAG: pyridoxal phosphate-dependent aminotransferase [Acidobacteriota bacterium]|nr:MAG: pyridoxal phosphate-dependent aminotransferase [Acidobacteriota bacterium]